MTDAVPDRLLAEAQLVGALAYGQLCTVAAAHGAVIAAPDLERARVLLDHAARERVALERLLDRVAELTDLRDPVVERQKPAFDAFFRAVPLDPWPHAMAFFAFSLPLAADFARAVAPVLSPASRDVVIDALAERPAFEAFAADQVRRHLDGADPDAATPDEPTSRHDRLRSLVADLLGRALTGLQAVMASSDALEVLLAASVPDPTGGADADGPADADRVAKHLAMEVLDGHRRRMHAFGLDDLA